MSSRQGWTEQPRICRGVLEWGPVTDKSRLNPHDIIQYEESTHGWDHCTQSFPIHAISANIMSSPCGTSTSILKSRSHRWELIFSCSKRPKCMADTVSLEIISDLRRSPDDTGEWPFGSPEPWIEGIRRLRFRRKTLPLSPHSQGFSLCSFPKVQSRRSSSLSTFHIRADRRRNERKSSMYFAKQLSSMAMCHLFWQALIPTQGPHFVSWGDGGHSFWGRG